MGSIGYLEYNYFETRREQAEKILTEAASEKGKKIVSEFTHEPLRKNEPSSRLNPIMVLKCDIE